MIKKSLSYAHLLSVPIERDGKKLSKDKLELSISRKATMEKVESADDTRRVSIAISTETPIRVVDLWSGEEYDEVLLHGEENVDLSIAKTAKLRYFHGKGKYGELPIGKLENVRLENRVLRAEAIFSKANPDADLLWAMVEEGTLTEISVGGAKQDLRITERDGEVPLVEVTRWLFKEASLVDIGADARAGINRSENNKGDLMNEIERIKAELARLRSDNVNNALIRAKEEELTAEIARVLSDSKSAQNDLQSAKDANKELVRQMEISTIAREYGDVDGETLNKFLSDTTKTPLDFSRSLLATKAENQSHIGFGRPSATADINRAMTDALVMRAGVNIKKPHPQSQQFVGMGLKDLAQSVTGYTGYNDHEMVERAMSTSDFPVLLGNVANRILSASFEDAEGTFHLWATAIDVPDFKKINEITVNGGGGRLKRLTEGGEKKSKEYSENAEEWKLFSYGDEITLTREMIINDDMGAFVSVISDFGRRTKQTANGIVYDLLQSKGDYKNYKMADGKAVFLATRKNQGTGVDLDTETLTEARTAMRRQTGIDGNALNIPPKFLIVSPERESKALQLIHSEADVSANQSGVMNPHKNSVQVIVESELDAEPWYLVAGRRTVKVGYLQGTNREPIVREKIRTLAYITFECVFDFGAVVEDYRGLYKNTGVSA